MIPRTLVPVDARPPAMNGTEPTTRRRPTNLDERTLVPAMLPIVQLDGRSTIPANLPLESISARVVVPRDINREAYNVVEDHSVPAQPSELDERVTVPLGSKAPEFVPPAEFTPPDIVAPDIFTTGHVHLVAQPAKEETVKWDAVKLVVSVSIHIVLVFVLIQFFARRPPTAHDEEIARLMTPLVAPSLADIEPSRTPAPPAPHIKVDPRTVARVAPTPVKPIEPPKVVEPPRELPSSPIAKPNAQQAPPVDNSPKTDAPRPALKLEIPDSPVARPNLTLPRDATSGPSMGSVLHPADRPSGPTPSITGGGAVRSGGNRGGGGTAYGGLEMLTPDEGVDFSGYLQRVYLTVKRNWFAVMPGSVELGEQGIVQLTFRINRDGSVSVGDPQIIRNSGKEPLDRAAYSSVRASNPFESLPPQFKGPFIELRYTYFYNIQPGSIGQ
jgi:outer membrane biosynthesis protein TonB